MTKKKKYNLNIRCYGLKSIKSFEIKSKKLDNFTFSNRISFIKIDVEGHEAHVFKGAAQLLDKNIPCVMELCPYMIKRSGMCLEEYIEIIQRKFH